MAKIGRNAPCPCGSGKKYKNCCLKKDEERQKYTESLDEAFARFYNANKLALSKSNNENYEDANFGDAMILTFTSNAISFIKAWFNNNYTNSASLLNLRNMIECLGLIFMYKHGDIDEGKEKLFLEQHKIIEYELYKNKDLGILVDNETLTEDYEYAKKKYLDAGINEAVFEKLRRTRVPFLCDTKINFNKILEKHLQPMVNLYEVLSMMIHPADISEYMNDDYLYDNIKLFIEILIDYSRNYKKGDCLLYTQMRDKILGKHLRKIEPQGSISNNILALVDEECLLLKCLADTFDSVYDINTYPGKFFRDVADMLNDITTDSLLGLCENVKIKVKVLFEKLASFNRVYFSYNADNYMYKLKMMSGHSLYKFCKLCDNIDTANTLREEAYSEYKNRCPESTISVDEFNRQFEKSLGYMINDDGKVPSLTNIVNQYIDTYAEAVLPDELKTKSKDYMKALYQESQTMSHSSGYLYFANTGAWADDQVVISLFDNMILTIVHMLMNFYAEADVNSESNKKMINKLTELYNKLSNIIKNKVAIASTFPKIKSYF